MFADGDVIVERGGLATVDAIALLGGIGVVAGAGR